MGYTITVAQLRSFTDAEWELMKFIIPKLSTQMEVNIGDDEIVHNPYEGYGIYKNINGKVEQYVKPSYGEEYVWLLLSIIDYYAPGVFYHEKDSFNAACKLLKACGYQYIELNDRVLYSIDYEHIIEFNTGDSIESLIDLYSSISYEGEQE